MGRMAFMQSLTASLATDTEEETANVN